MTVRHLYLIAGVAWALVLGPAVAQAVFGVAAGAAWLWMFGDDPWPEATHWILPLIGLAAGLLAAGLCVGFAMGAGRRAAARTPAGRQRAGRAAIVLIAAAVAAMAATGAAAWRQAAEESEAASRAARQEAAFADLVAARHAITDIAVVADGAGAVRATVALAGRRAGSYRLHWQVADTGFGAVLAEGERLPRLDAGAHEIVLAFDVADLGRRYAETVLDGRGGVLVEEPFRLTLTLAPVLGKAELAALPPGERHRLARGRPPLGVRETALFPVRFVIRRDGSIGR